MSERHLYAKVLVRVPQKILDEFDKVCSPGHRSRNEAIVRVLVDAITASKNSTQQLAFLKYLKDKKGAKP